MVWYYNSNNETKGPFSEADLTTAIQAGSIQPNTLVWKEGLHNWTAAARTELATLFERNTSGVPQITPSFQPPIINPAAPTGAQASNWDIDPKLIYPSNPPQSPHLALLNILIVGLGQMLLGQLAKGFVILIAAVFFGALTAGISFLVLAPVAIIDGYLVGNMLKSGRPVGKWQFFPT